MRLKYSRYAFAVNTFLIYGCFVVMLFMILVCGAILGDAIQNGAGTRIIAIMATGLVLIIGLGLLLVNTLKYNVPNLKVGETLPGSIIEAHDSAGGGMGRLVVSYHNGENVFYVNNVEKNDAYELLKLLLNPFPVKENVRVPITLYQNKHTIYADLDSVNLIPVPGYEECKKIVEQRYQEK